MGRIWRLGDHISAALRELENVCLMSMITPVIYDGCGLGHAYDA